MPVNVELSKSPRQDGRCRVRLSVYRAGMLRRMGLDIHIFPKHWDKVAHRVKIGEPMHALHNRAIAAAVERATAIGLEHPTWTAQEVIDAMQLPSARGVRLHEAITQVLQVRADRFATGTRDRLRYILRACREALPLATLDGVTEADAHAFRTWIAAQPGANGERVGQNTVRNRVKMLRTLYGHACSHFGVPRRDVFADVIPREVPVLERSLTPEQFQRLKNYTAPERLRLAQDAFLLAVYLGGMRFGDLFDLTADRITEAGLALRQRKTSAVVYAELGDAAKAIVQRYQGGPKVLPLGANKEGANARINAHLKVIAAACDLPADLSFHWARHAAGDLLEARGVDIRTIQLLFGHSTIQQTVDYLSRRRSKQAGAALKGLG